MIRKQTLQSEKISGDKIQVLKRIVVYGCVSDPAPRIRIDSIQLLQDDGGLGVTHPLKPICGHIPLAHGCMFRIQNRSGMPSSQQRPWSTA